MIRSPKLCDLFYKTERRIYEKEMLEKIYNESIQTLHQYDFKNN